MKRIGWFLFSLVGAAACSGQQVALNERIFDAQTMEPKGGGCTTYKLGSGESSGQSGGGVGAALVVRQRSAGDRIIVSVDEAGKAIVQREYDETFFSSPRLDEFTATSRSGAESLLLRYWGSLMEGGTGGCAPLTDEAPATR